jgi:hypothetical protein
MQLAEPGTARGVHRSFAANNAAQDDMESAGKVKCMQSVRAGADYACLRRVN